MKTFVYSLLTCAVVFSLASCSKEVSEETGATVITGSNFTATINGSDWKADSLEQVIVNDSIVSITGVSSTNQEISLVLPNFAVGKYTVNASTAGYGQYNTLGSTQTDVYLTNTSVEAAKASGTIEITAIDTLNKTVTGTFSFTGYRASDQTTVSVTNGVFKALAYSQTGSGNNGGVDSTINDNGRDTLSAVIDGVLSIADRSTIQATTTDFDPSAIQVSIVGLTSTSTFDGFSITLPIDITPGSHKLVYPNSPTISYNLTSAGKFYVPSGTDGTVKILTNDQANKRITGQFSYIGYEIGDPTQKDTKKFTSGYFGVTYP